MNDRQGSNTMTSIDTHPLVHALAHAWPVWTHHIDPFYVCSDDTFDLLYGVVSDDEYQALEVAVFESLAAHGIPLDATVYEVAEVYACPDGLPMPPLHSAEEVAEHRAGVEALRKRLGM